MARSSKPLEGVSPNHQGQQLRTYLDHNGIPHNFLSKGLNKQPSTVNGYLNSVTITVKTRQAILKLLGASYEQVFQRHASSEQPLALHEEIEHAVRKFSESQQIEPSLVGHVLRLQGQLGQISQVIFQSQLEGNEEERQHLREQTLNLAALAMILLRKLS